jgi:Family of unknown function (DUF6252)
LKTQAVVALVLLLVTLVECAKDEHAPLAPEGTMIAAVDTLNWTSSAPTAIFANNTVFISGIGEGGSTVKIFVKGSSTGTYTIAGTIGGSIPENYVVYETAASVFVAAEQVGEVRITEIDNVKKTLSGTFMSKAISAHFAMESTIQIKNGSFTKIPFTTATTSPGSPASTATAKIENVDFESSYTSGKFGYPGYIFVNFSDGSRSISMHMRLLDPGSYEINPTSNADYGVGYSNATQIPAGSILGMSYRAAAGTLVISVHNLETRRLEGTFEFTAQPSDYFGGGAPGAPIQITHGVFALTYIYP